VLHFFGKYSYGLYVYHGLFHEYLLEAGVEGSSMRSSATTPWPWLPDDHRPWECRC
jgi:hypothetical protein